MKEMTCIICPVGCALEIDDNFSVAGNKCPRGEAYALEEIRAPKRTVTATCKIDGETEGAIRRIPVKTVTPCPKDKIPALLREIHKKKIKLPVNVGDIIISNWNNEGIDIITTRTVG